MNVLKARFFVLIAVQYERMVVVHTSFIIFGHGYPQWGVIRFLFVKVVNVGAVFGTSHFVRESCSNVVAFRVS
jgi:hypothetical protein